VILVPILVRLILSPFIIVIIAGVVFALRQAIKMKVRKT
jgi:hypothetical protein